MKSLFQPALAGSMLILALLTGACSAIQPQVPTATIDLNPVYTQAAQTMVVQFTQTALAIPSATATATASPSPAPTATQTNPAVPLPTLTPTVQPLYPVATPVPIDPGQAFGCYNASFVADVPAWNNPAFKPGQAFTKTWRVKNTGTCDWPRGFLMMFLSGDSFGTQTQPIDQKVLAGEFADITLNLTAPRLSGMVTSYWSLATDTGKPFGPVLPVTISLPGTLTGTLTSGDCLSSALVEEVTYPSGSQVKAGTSFTKTWLIENSGTCTWNGNFRMTYIGGNPLGGDTTRIRKTIASGGQAEISIKMTAPTIKGIYTSSWQLSSDGGQLFGVIFQFKMVVR